MKIIAEFGFEIINPNEYINSKVFEEIIRKNWSELSFKIQKTEKVVGNSSSKEIIIIEFEIINEDNDINCLSEFESDFKKLILYLNIRYEDINTYERKIIGPKLLRYSFCGKDEKIQNIVPAPTIKRIRETKNPYVLIGKKGRIVNLSDHFVKIDLSDDNSVFVKQLKLFGLLSEEKKDNIQQRIILLDEIYQLEENSELLEDFKVDSNREIPINKYVRGLRNALVHPRQKPEHESTKHVARDLKLYDENRNLRTVDLNNTEDLTKVSSKIEELILNTKEFLRRKAESIAKSGQVS